jgi:hypothetical protein
MRIRTFGLTALLCLAALTFSLAQNPNMGTWKLNEAKSEIPAGVGKNATVVYASATGDMIKITTDGVDAAGQSTHTEWTGKFDAKPYPLTGDANADYRAYRTKGERRLQIANMKGNTTVSNGTIEVAKDGKSRTVSMNYLDGKKKKAKAKFVYDKQQ